eukprot:752856-Rhodomonas_salina.3
MARLPFPGFGADFRAHVPGDGDGGGDLDAAPGPARGRDGLGPRCHHPLTSRSLALPLSHALRHADGEDEGRGCGRAVR